MDKGCDIIVSCKSKGKNMGQEDRSILNKIADNVIRDYYTAGIKSEVILDTLLTPVITEVVKKAVDKEGKELFDPDNEPVFITKEFPLIKNADVSNRNTKADFLLYDKNTVYLVELKTTAGSTDDKAQLEHYREKLKGKDGGKLRFKTLAEEFIVLLNAVRYTGIGSKKEGEQEKEKLKYKDLKGELKEEDKSGSLEESAATADGEAAAAFSCLEKLYDRIVERAGITKAHGKDSSSDGRERIPAPAELYLKGCIKNGSYGSKKLLMQAEQLLEVGEEKFSELWEKEVKIIYIVPDNSYDDIIKKELGEQLAWIVHLREYVPEKADDEAYAGWLYDSILRPLFGSST